MDSLKSRGLIWLGDHTAYLPGGVNSGIVVNENKEAVIIDTGLDSSSGNKILRALEQEGISPIAIINTHAHADHFGGNSAILKKFSIPVYATLVESSNMQNPIIEPSFLYGANPPKGMKNKFIMAEKSAVDHIIDIAADHLLIKDINLNIIDFSGHSQEMIGVGYKSEALFIGDCLLPGATLEKYPIIYCYDVEKALEKLEKLKTIKDYRYFVPAHGKHSELSIEDVDLNINSILQISKDIYEYVAIPKSREDLIENLYAKYGISENMPQYYLTAGSVGAHLTYLLDKDLISSRVEKGILKFFR